MITINRNAIFDARFILYALQITQAKKEINNNNTSLKYLILYFMYVFIHVHKNII